ncbi:MAG: PAS domain S-box protein [Prolixibacteraceae bacterium]|nr:PAS domain S-box protein [Prolixibacteraceae bacterium]
MNGKNTIDRKGVISKFNRFKYLLLFLFIVLIVFLIVAGYMYYKHEKETSQKDKYNELRAIAQLKTNQLNQWHKERLSEALYFTTNQPYIRYALNILHGKHDEDSIFRKSLLHIMSGNRYENIFMLNEEGKLLFSVLSGFSSVDTATIRFSAKAFQSGKIVSRDFYYCNTHKNVRLELIAPVFEKEKVAATLIFLVDPDDFLYPLITEWPTPGNTGETYIVRQMGDSIQYLSPLRFSPAPPLRSFSSILQPGSIGSILLQRHDGIIECKDYRGESVLASVLEVPGTSWHIISKIDRKEAFSGLNTTLTFLIILLFLAVLLFIVFALLFYHYKQRNIYRELLIEKELLYQAREEFKATFYSMGDGVITTTCKGNISQINPIAEILTGWIEHEAKGELLENVFCIIDEQSREKEKEIVKKILKGSEYAVISQQKTLVSKNDTEIPVIFSATPVKDQKGNILGAVIVFSDQREQREKEKALIESEKSYKELIDGMNETVWIIDFNGTLLDVNRTATELLGYSKEKLLEIGLYGIDASLKKEAIQGLTKTMPVDQIQIFETTHRKKSGEIIPVEVYSSLINYRGQKAILSIARDITERKKAEQLISEERIRLRTLIDNLPDAIYVKDNKGRKLAANAADLKMMGCSSEKEIIGKNDIEIYGMEIGTNGYDEDMQVIKMGVPMLNKEDSYVTENGEKHWRTISKIPLFDEKGEITGLVGFGRDITRQKHDENVQQILYQIVRASMESKSLEELLVTVRGELSKVLDTTNFYVARYNLQADTLQKIIFINEKFDIDEWETKNTLSGQVIKTQKTLLLYEDDLKEHAVRFKKQKSFATSKCWLGVPLIDGEKILGVIVLQSYNNPNAYNKGSARLLEMIAHELVIVIQRKQMINDLIAAKEKAEESDRLKSAFLANISHEIRTPMNGILGFLELLGEPDLKEEQKGMYLDIMEQSGQRLLETINGIVEISKIESMQIDLHFSEVDIPITMTFHRDFFSQKAAKKGLKLKLNEEQHHAQTHIYTDKSKLNGILTNLLNNAIKYTSEGEIEFGFNPENDSIVFYVKDTGQGIAKDQIDTMFERFTQANTGYTRTQEGSGLGLAIVKAYVEALGGKVWVESVVGKGSTFYFSIPQKVKS